MSPQGNPLFGEQYAAIAWAEPSESTIALSQRLGVDAEVVRQIRQRIARAGGWWCELVVLTCQACGLPLLVGASQRQQFARRDHDRKRQLALHRRHDRTLAVMQATYQRDLPRTGPYTFRDHVPWTPEEDARRLATLAMSAHHLSVELGRSPASIYMRRSRLRRQLN